MTAAGLPFSTEAVLESLPDGFQAFDRDWRYVYLNRRAEQILGRPRAELLGRVCWAEYPEAVGTPFHAKYLEAMEAGRTVVFEDFCPHEETWVEFTLHPYPGGLGAFTRDITERKRVELAVRQSEERYRALFDRVLDPVLLADDAGVYVDANPAACELIGLPREGVVGRRIVDFTPPDAGVHAKQAWAAFLRSGEQSGEFVLRRPDGTDLVLEYRAKANVLPGLHLSALRDVTAAREAAMRTERLLADLRDEREALDRVNRVGRLLSAELDLERLVQAATDAATEMTGAQFGAFFYNVVDAAGEAFLLYTISGAPREAFAAFPHPRATGLFGPTFRGEGVIRLGDVARDPRYGRWAPFHGMPPGHLPVRSYLAVPVVSRSGEVLGGLFFGHAEPDVFTERAERSVQALVSHVAVAVDNARLFGRVQREVEERRAAEEARRDSEEFQRRLVESSSDCIKTLGLDGRLRSMSEAGRRAFGVEDFAALAGADWVGFWQGADREAAAKAVAEARAGRTGRFRGYCPTRDGTPRWWDVVVTPVLDGRGRPELLLCVSRDVTEEREAERRQRRFVREMLFGMTEGRLRLCDGPGDLPARLAPDGGEPVALTRSTLRLLRKRVEAAAERAGLVKERAEDLLTGVGEAGMNAVTHAGGGRAEVCADAAAGRVQVWITDTGGGITHETIHKATLERGWTTAGTLGHGFWLMLRTCDRVYLLTGPHGTTVVLEQQRDRPEPPWLRAVG
jgi:PAS domain S-box-containing protein